RSIVHCEIYSDNILIGTNGHVKLSDFSSAVHLTADQKSVHKSTLGAVYWMAPELAKGSGYAPSTDVWALGATVYEMIEGHPPYEEYPELKVLELASTKGMPAPSDPTAWSRDLVGFMNLCCTVGSAERPTASRLLKHRLLVGQDSARSPRMLLEFSKRLELELEDEDDDEESDED
ncbi:hypothetical protein EC988_009559, partial [Linderina pennispora]